MKLKQSLNCINHKDIMNKWLFCHCLDSAIAPYSVVHDVVSQNFLNLSEAYNIAAL